MRDSIKLPISLSDIPLLEGLYVSGNFIDISACCPSSNIDARHTIYKINYDFISSLSLSSVRLICVHCFKVHGYLYDNYQNKIIKMFNDKANATLFFRKIATV
jgi:hypothetical protein